MHQEICYIFGVSFGRQCCVVERTNFRVEETFVEMLAPLLWRWAKLWTSVYSSKNKNTSTIIMQDGNTIHEVSGTTLGTQHTFNNCYLYYYFAN